MIRISCLRSFVHIYGSKRVSLKQGGVYYLDMDKAEDREELLYMLSGSYPYRNFISIEMGPALMQVLSMSKFNARSAAPTNPQEGDVYYNTLSKKAYYWNGSVWVEFPGVGGGTGTGGSGTPGTPFTIPALFGDVVSTGFSNEVSIAPGVIVDGDISASAAIKLSKLEKDPLNRMNHTGVQPASTIVDFHESVRTNRLDQMAAPANDLDMANNRIMNVKNPTADQDAVNKRSLDAAIDNISLSDLKAPIADFSMAGFGFTNLKDPVAPLDSTNKKYVDELLSKVAAKAPVRVVATMPISLAGTQAVDGRTVNIGDRVLVAGQSDARANGIYTVQSGAWMRSPDADTSDKLSSGVMTYVQDGVSFSDTQWIMTSPNGPVVLGVSNMTFGQPGLFTAGDGLIRTGNNVHAVGKPGEIVAYPDQLGIDPMYAGQTSINTLGTVTTGRWQATPIDLPFGGTGATTAAQARNNLQAAKSGINSDITQLTGLTTPLTIPQGGTGASTPTDARINLQAAKSGVNSDITQLTGLTTPLSITQGGTGASDPSAARTNLQSAKSGANSDITSLSAPFTAPMRIDQGGTNATTALDARVNIDAARTVLNIGGGARVFLSKDSNTDLNLRTLVAASGNRAAVQETSTTITVDVVEANLLLQNIGGALDVTTSKITGIMPIAKGGTNASTAPQALRNLGGIGTVLREPSSTGVSIVGAKDGADPTRQYMKGLLPASNKVVTTAGAFDVSVDVDETNIPINNLSGVLTIAKGGTNATTADQALKNLGGIADAINLGSGEDIFLSKNTSGAQNILEFKGVMGLLDGITGGAKVLVASSGNDVSFTVNESQLDLSLMGGTLDILNGGTGATTAGQALTNLGGVSNGASSGGVAIYRGRTAVAGAGFTLDIKGLQATSNKVAVVASPNTVDIDVVEANILLPNLGGVLPIIKGGTGATTVPQAQINLGIPKSFTNVAPITPAIVGAGPNYSATITHNLALTATQRVLVFAVDSSGEVEIPTSVSSSANAVTLTFGGPTGPLFVSVITAGA
jgi:hypothetical protein